MFSFIFIVFCVVILDVDGMHLPGAQVQPCGEEASPNLIHQNPWLVLLEYYRRGSRVDVRCGGSLVSRRHVITAAHCLIKADIYKVRVGEYNLKTEQDCVHDVCAEAAVHIDVIDVTIHPAYDGASHDIAVLTLAHDAPYTDFIRPICLPSTHPTNATFTSAGWGEIPKTIAYSDVKKIIPLPQWDSTECQAAYHTNLPQDVICAGGQEGLDTCRGDSGGPLVEYKTKAELAGVTSKGYTVCGTEGKPGIYTSVRKSLDWIKGVMDKV